MSMETPLTRKTSSVCSSGPYRPPLTDRPGAGRSSRSPRPLGCHKRPRAILGAAPRALGWPDARHRRIDLGSTVRLLAAGVWFLFFATAARADHVYGVTMGQLSPAPGAF